MKRVSMIAAGAALLLTASIAAQPVANVAPTKEERSAAGMAEMMRAMFKVEPLTPEQLARLPQAQAVIAKMMPPGTLQEMMGRMFDKFLSPLMATQSGASRSQLARELGVRDDEDFALKDTDAARVAAILDPAWKERRKAEMAAAQRAVTVALTAMEPAMRKSMAEAYAVTFTGAELAAIDRFFSTPEGATFARKSYALASDPRIMAGAMEGLPAMLGQMKALEGEVKAATASLPKPRGYDDLTAAQREELARLTGLDQTDLRAGMGRAAEERAKPKAE